MSHRPPREQRRKKNKTPEIYLIEFKKKEEKLGWMDAWRVLLKHPKNLPASSPFSFSSLFFPFPACSLFLCWGVCSALAMNCFVKGFLTSDRWMDSSPFMRNDRERESERKGRRLRRRKSEAGYLFSPPHARWQDAKGCRGRNHVMMCYCMFQVQRKRRVCGPACVFFFFVVSRRPCIKHIFQSSE